MGYTDRILNIFTLNSPPPPPNTCLPAAGFHVGSPFVGRSLKRDGSYNSPFSKKYGDVLRLRIWRVARGTGKMAALKRGRLGTRLLVDVLTCHGIFLNLRPLKITTRATFSC